MYVSIVGRRHRYVRLCETHRNEKGKSQTFVVENLGRLDRLLKEDPNFLEKLEARCEADRKEKEKLIIEQQTQAVARTVTPKRYVEKKAVFKVGHFPILKLIRTSLKLPAACQYWQRKNKIQTDYATLLSFMVASKLMKPCSIPSLFLTKDIYLGDPLRYFSEANVYQMLDFLGEHKDPFLNQINRELDRELGENREKFVFTDGPTTDYDATEFADNITTFARQCLNALNLTESSLDTPRSTITHVTGSNWRLLKSLMGVRVGDLRTISQVQGYAVLCSIALVVFRLLQYKLTEMGTPMSVESIQEALNSATVTATARQGDVVYTPSIPPMELRMKSPELQDDEMIPQPRADEYIQINPFNRILEAIGLEPAPQSENSGPALLRSFGTVGGSPNLLIPREFHLYMGI